MNRKKTLASIIKGTVMGVGAAGSVAAGYFSGMFVANKVYDKTGDITTSTVAGSIAGVAVMEITNGAAGALYDKVDSGLKKLETDN